MELGNGPNWPITFGERICTDFSTGLGRYFKKSVHPSGFEPETFGSVDRCSIQLSYGCITIFVGLEMEDYNQLRFGDKVQSITFS